MREEHDDHLELQTAYTDYSRMQDWPHVPSRDRLDRAEAIILRDEVLGELWRPEDLEDAQAYIERVEAERFREWAMQTFVEARRQDPDRQILPLLEEIARRGETWQTIGLALLQAPPPEQISQEQAGEGELMVAFTRLPRDPGWMGLDPALPSLRGLLAGVYESPVGGSPSYIVALPPAYAGDPPLENPIPEEYAHMGRLLEWHGAQPFWLPSEYALRVQEQEGRG